MNPERDSGPEAPDEQPHPRIYVASLSDYNAGRLHGAWIDAAQEPSGIQSQVDEMLGQSPEPIAEEWAIHDYEGFGYLAISEYESFDVVAQLAAGITEHGLVFAAWAEHLDRAEWDEQLDRFDESYRGEWASIEEYAEDLLDAHGYRLDQLGPPELQPYLSFDLAAWAKAMTADLIVVNDERNSTVHIFEKYD